MNLSDLIILLPCYSMEDLTLDRDAVESEQILAAWSSLFHPLLLSRAGTAPRWERADDPPREPSEKLILVPGCCESLLPEDWVSESESAGAYVIRDFHTRDDLLDMIFKRLEIEPPTPPIPLTDDFLALGFCHLQVELLTRQLRYMSNLDEAQFEEHLSSAAGAAITQEIDTAGEHLQSAFELLTEAREYFYPIETYLLDWTLVAPTTIGPALRRQLASKTPSNVLLSAETLEVLALQEPETLSALSEALSNEQTGLASGDLDERELPLLPPEATFALLRRALEVFERHLGRRPKVFARRRFGLSPMLPQILKEMEYTGAIHFTLDDGRFPTGNQSKIRWKGLGDVTLDALVRLPLDAAGANGFLRLPERLGDVMDLDHAATALFAHWPDSTSIWYDDLRRMNHYSPVLGRFFSIDQYFEDTHYVGQSVCHDVDQYRSPYLRQAVVQGKRDPISRWVRYHGRRVAADASWAVWTMGNLLVNRFDENRPEIDFFSLVDDSLHQVDLDSELDTKIRNFHETSLQHISRSLPRADQTKEPGYLALNPWTFARRQWLDVSNLPTLPDAEGPIVATMEAKDQKWALVETPPMGFAWIGAGKPKTVLQKTAVRPKRSQKTQTPPLVEDHTLRNDFFEVSIDPTTGAIRAIHDYRTRGSRLTQQIALRLPHAVKQEQGLFGEDDELDYSIMSADKISIGRAGPVLGEITSLGRLLDRHGRRLARFSQTVRIERASRVLELDIELTPDTELDPDPWNSYYAVRFAWGDATADLFRGVSLTNLATDTAQLESPYFVDIRGEKTRTTILTGGLPYHRRLGLRKLDTLLVVRGERARRFRVGVGIDLEYPVAAALDFLAPQAVCTETSAPPVHRSGWLFHVGSKNVIATHWEPLEQDDRILGFRVRLLETEGRVTQTSLQCFRPIGSACQVDFLGENPTPILVDSERIPLEMKPHAWIQLEVQWG